MEKFSCQTSTIILFVQLFKLTEIKVELQRLEHRNLPIGKDSDRTSQRTQSVHVSKTNHFAHLRQECHNSKFEIFELLV